ncbi:hypothetical protein JCM10296v2_007723 [Rhodotorula toruloides]
MVNFCAGTGILFSFAATILLVFVHITQITPSLIPRDLRIVAIDTSGLSTALAAAAKSSGVSIATGNFSDIYNAQPVGQGYFVKGQNESRHDGLRKTYEWGLWSYCSTNGNIGSPRSYCIDRSINERFEPAQVLMEDIPTQYSDLLQKVLPSNVFTADNYLGSYTEGASYVILAGSLATALAALIGLFARRGAFILSCLFSIVGFLGLAVGAVIYQVIYTRAQDAINQATTSGVDLGITLDYGNALWILWAATGLMLLAIVPYAVACCTGRYDRAY